MENPPPPGSEAALDRREAEHLFRVLRAAPGERFRLLDGQGKVSVASVRPDRVLFVESEETIPEPGLKLHLFFAQPRRNRLDALLPACSELGVWQLHPVSCARSVAEGAPNDRWRLQLVEGCKQSGNPYLPSVAPPEPLLPALKRSSASGMALFFGSVAAAAEPAAPVGTHEVGWVVGPEGGFTPEEEEGLRELGVAPLNLGPFVMRLETAAVCGLAALRRMLGVLLLLSALLFSGCGDREVSRHPLVRKGDYYRESGDAKLAAEFYRRAVWKFPDASSLHLKLATLCDESLDDPLGAAWHYTEYLSLAPGAADRETVEAYRKAALERLSAARSERELKKLAEENRRLRAVIGDLKRTLVAQLRRNEAASPERYTVRAGDTPALVARRNRVELDALLRANKLTRSSRLRIGQELVIPRTR